MPKDNIRAQIKTKLNRKSKEYMKHARDLVGKDRDVQNAFNQFSAEIDALNTMTEAFIQSEKILDENDIKNLTAAYDKAIRAYGKLGDLIERKGKKVRASFGGNIRAVGKMLSKDIAMLRRFDPEEPHTLSDYVKMAHTQVLDLSQMNREKILGSYMNHRKAVRVKQGNRFVDGLFTPKNTVRGRAGVIEVANQKNEQNATKYDPNFLHFLNYCDLKCQDNGFNIAEALRYIKVKYKTVKEKRVPVGMEVEYPLTGILEPNTFLAGYHKDAQNIIISEFEKFKKELGAKHGPDGISLKAKIPDGGRIDQRNSAVSAVAEILGIDGLVAKSVPMVIKNGNVLTEGNFMKFVSGASDVKHLKADDPLLQVSQNNLDNSTGLISNCADIQVLDFICGNIDRHHANVMYHVSGTEKKQKVEGLTAIDNDTSLGVLVDRDDLKYGYHHLPGLNRMGIIRKSTADAVKNMTPALLKMVLAPYQLSKAELDAACFRLQMLKDALNEKYVNDDNVPDFSTLKQKMERGNDVLFTDVDARTNKKNSKTEKCIYVLRDDQIEKLRISDVYIRGNLFSKTRAAILSKQDIFRKAENPKRMIGSEQPEIERPALEKGNKEGIIDQSEMQSGALPEVKNNLLDMPEVVDNGEFPEVSFTEKGTELDLQKYAVKLAEYVNNLRTQNKGLFISSIEYDNVLAYATMAHEELYHIINRELPELSQAELASMFSTLNSLSQIYLDKKELEDSAKNGERDARRVLAVQELADFTKDIASRTQMDNHEYYSHLCYQQRAGVFNRSNKNAEIAEHIASMRKMQEKRIADFYKDIDDPQKRQRQFGEQSEIVHVFDGVSKAAWKKTFEEYRQEFRKYNILQFRNLPEGEFREQLDTLKHNLQGKPSLRQMELVKTALHNVAVQAQQYLRDHDNINNVEVMAANGLISLDQKARKDAVAPVSDFMKTKIAEKLLASELEYNPEEISNLRNHEAYKQKLKDFKNRDAFKAMINKKKPQELKEIMEEPNAKLQLRFQRYTREKGLKGPALIVE